MRLYFVRHGESEANILRVISNRGYRYGLTQGSTTSYRLATFEHVPFGIFSSPLRRAVETADISLVHLGGLITSLRRSVNMIAVFGKYIRRQKLVSAPRYR